MPLYHTYKNNLYMYICERSKNNITISKSGGLTVAQAPPPPKFRGVVTPQSPPPHLGAPANGPTAPLIFDNFDTVTACRVLICL